VQEGDAELLFIKRAGRAGDRWSGHTALPGGKRDPEDADDLAAAIRETREEVGLDLETAPCLKAGNLPERLVSTSWGKEVLMVLCPYIFVLTGKTVPAIQPQPTEVASVHWVSLRALLSPTLRTRESVDISSRMAKHVGPTIHKLIRWTMGKMMFSAIRLLPTESIYASSIPGLIPDKGGDQLSSVSGWAQAPFGVPSSSQSLGYQQPIILWGLTLGVLADLLDQLPPYNAVKLWKYPTFTVPDLRLLVWILTRSFRKNSAETFSSGSWPNQTAMDATTQATAVSTSEPRGGEEHAPFHRDSVGIGGLGVGKDPQHAVGRLLHGYYERVNVAIAVFLTYRVAVAAGVAVWIYKYWKRRRGANL
jgi:8-oxo-dGTP pyrophosphatase MutT (NUDIX family)